METSENRNKYKHIQKFLCELCDYSTRQQSDYDRHCATLKHKMAIGPVVLAPRVTHSCNICLRKFMSNSGLWKHNQNCKSKTTILVEMLISENNQMTKIVSELIEKKETSEIKQLSVSETILLEFLRNRNDILNQLMVITKNTKNLTLHN
jgi:hypothetical protein